MTLEWLPRDNSSKDHILMGPEHWGTEAPCTVYEKKPLTSPEVRFCKKWLVSIIVELRRGPERQ